MAHPYSVECWRAQVPQSKRNEKCWILSAIKQDFPSWEECKQCFWVCYGKCVVGSSSISIFHLLSFIHIYSKLSILKNQHANTHSIFADAVWVKIFFVYFFLFRDLKWVTKLSDFLFSLKEKYCLFIRSKFCPVLSEYFAHGPEGPRFLLLMILE